METTNNYAHSVNIPLYRGKLVLIFSSDARYVKAKAGDFDDDYVFAQSRIVNWNGRQGFAIILNPWSKGDHITHGVIAHEALHTANFIANKRGIDVDGENDEPIAYLVMWITDQVYKGMRRFGINTETLI